MAKKYLQLYAQRVVDQGYDICFIRPGEKRPFGKDWEAKTHGPKRIASAIEAGRGGYGVGIKTALTPGVDIDCYDEDVVEKMIDFTQEMLGESLTRIGMAPKTLLVYRAKKPFPKTQSRVFIDDEGRAVKLEVLGDGQQFVAFHIHPDTEKPYQWIGDSVLDVEHSDLPLITQDDALEIVAKFEKLARKKGWPEKNTVKRLSDSRSSGKEYNHDDPFITDKPKVDLTPEDLRKKLLAVPNADDYDTWFHVGMALHHQFDGAEEGLLMWHEWSAEASNYDMDVLDDKWATFDIEGKKREPITARFIIKQAIAEEERLAGEELDEIKDDIRNAGDLRQFQEVMDRIKHTAFAPMIRESLALALKERIKKATDSTLPIAMIRRAISFENPEHRSTPAWLRDWVFVQQDESFYNRRTRQVMTTKAFDLSFGRFLLTKKDILEGISTPENSASHVAVHRFQIPAVANKMYAPLEDEFFDANQLTYVNSYSDATVPDDVPDTLTPKQIKRCERIMGHLEHLFPNARDRKLLLSWLAYIVQTNGKINWSPVVQGVENDGKSFFGRMMAAVLGGENVNTINGDSLSENYTDFAEGCQFLMIEEVRLHGMDRFAVINKLKTYVANDMVTIRRMRTDKYKVLNTVNYFLTTNHKDGVPVDENSSRYFPLFSRFQTKRALAAFNKANPDYYKKLHAVLDDPGVLRRWLLDYELHEDFNPVERATESAALAEMQYLNQTEEQEGIMTILEDSDEPDLTWELVNSTKLAERMSDEGIPVPYGQAWKRLLSERGFSPLGKVRVGKATPTFWSQTPEKFRTESGKTDHDAVRDFAEPI